MGRGLKPPQEGPPRMKHEDLVLLCYG